MKLRTRILPAVGLSIVALLVWVGRPRPPTVGDADGDGRYQRVEWAVPDEAGSPTMLRAYIGAYRSGFHGLATRVSVADDGVIGVFHQSGQDVFDNLFSSLTEEQPAILWDLSTYPPGTEFTITVNYEDRAGAIIDTETFTTTRPAATSPGGGR